MTLRMDFSGDHKLLEGEDTILRNDKYALAWFSGEPVDMFPFEEQIKVQVPAMEHEIGTYSDFLRAMAQIL